MKNDTNPAFLPPLISDVITEPVFLLLLWKWLNMSSIAMFPRQALGTFKPYRDASIGDIRSEIQKQLDALSFAG